MGYIVEFYYRGTNFRKKRASPEDAIRLINRRVSNIFSCFFFFLLISIGKINSRNGNCRRSCELKVKMILR